MTNTVEQALLESKCTSFSEASVILDRLAQTFINDPVPQLYAISQAKDRARNSNISFLQSLSSFVKIILDQHTKEQDERKLHHSRRAGDTTLFRVPPSTLGFYFKNDCCPRFLHTACSVTSTTTGRLELPEFMRLMTLKGLLLEKGFQWEKDLEDLLRNPDSSTCVLMRDETLAWWSNERFSPFAASARTARTAYDVISLDKDKDDQKLKADEHIVLSLQSLRTAPAGTALVQSRFRVPQLIHT